MSFTVFARARPIRTAFLLSEAAGFDTVCDGLVTWSMESWGGRENAIALIEEDGTLSEDARQELARFDPDQICSLAPLSDELLAKLDEEFAPWLMPKPEGERPGGEPDDELNGEADATITNLEAWDEMSIRAAGVAVPPTERNLAALQKRPLLLFDFGKDCPALLRRFLHRNLGTYHQWFAPRSGEVRRDAWMEDHLPGIPVERLQVNCIASLCAAMERIAGKRPGPEWKLPLACTAPCQLSSIHLPRPFPRGDLDRAYRVVVGSGLRDFLLYWRSCLNEGRGVWDVPFRHCLWVPAELIREEPFVAALKNWLYCFTGQGSSGSLSVELTSVSLSAEQLSPLVDAWRTGGFCMHTRLVTAADLETRWRNERARDDDPPQFIPPLNGNNSQQFESVERTRTLELRPPEVIQAEVPSGTWALDVQIAREPREGGLPGQDWWVLPRRSGHALATSMFGTRTRISRCGLFAVQVERTSKWPGVQTTPRLELRLPSDDQVVAGLILTNSRAPWFDYSDARRDRLQFQPVVTGMAISDAGRKLRGLIELFGGFGRAKDYWERTFWQDVFCQMARRGTRYEARLRVETEQRIQAELRRSLASLSEADGQQVARKITRRVLNGLADRFRDAPMTFAEMEAVRVKTDEAFKAEQPTKDTKEIKYLAGDTWVHKHGITPVTREEFEQGLEELLKLGVFRIGVEMSCPRCRQKHWVGADNLHQSDSCPGCASAMPLRPETLWSYRLNPLIHQCINSHALAVWQALAELALRPDAFFFTPSSKLYFAQPIDGGNEKEFDVLCVTDGELLLGEVKDCELEPSDFEKFFKMVAVLRPERAAMFVSEEYYIPFKGKVDKLLASFQQQLAPLGVRGELHCLPSY